MSGHELDTEAVYRLRARASLGMKRMVIQGGGGGGVTSLAPPLDPERTRPGNDLPYETRHTSFDNNIVIVTGALLLLLMAVLLLHCLLRCLARRLRHPLPPAPQPLPMKKQHIRSLPSFRCHSSSDQVSATSNCAICLADFTDGELIRLLPACQHGFHAACVDEWLQRQATCPTCRADLLNGDAKTTPAEAEAVITPAGEVCVTLAGDPKDHHVNPS